MIRRGERHNVTMPPTVNIRIAHIISGAQTGADRAALDWAIAHGLPHGGWCPAGRRAEDGVIPDIYQMRETPSRAYESRTKCNVRDSDATLIISKNPELSGGSKRTREFAIALGKPCLHLHAGLDSAAALRDFLASNPVTVLNIAGPRESTEPGIGSFVLTTLDTCRDSFA